MILLIDNYDSFSYNLYQLIGELNPDIRVIRNDEMTVDEIRALKPDRIVLSPGPGRPENAGVILDVVRELGPEIPILGVCLGHLHGLRRRGHLRETADARQAVRRHGGSGLSAVPGLPAVLPRCAVSFPGGG